MTDPISLVRRLAAGGKLSHAWLITGSGEAERREAAAVLARALVCSGEEKPCGRCPHCKKAAQSIHPDVITVGPEEGKRDILVDQIRAVRSDAYIRPNEAGRKVYLIDPAQSMNQAAQNALLKVLEEGPEYAAFLLLAEAAGQMLPTVRSRCEQLTLTPPARPEAVPHEGAALLAGLLLEGEESALLAHCVGLEKLNREEWGELLKATIMELEGRLRTDLGLAPAVLPKIDLLKELERACGFNAGAGHLAGWLCAAAFS